MSEQDGGPAFPRTGVGNAGQQYDVPPQDGMSLRDYFAAKAMHAVLTNDKRFVAVAETYEKEAGIGSRDAVAQYAYEYADAMLRARTSTESPTP